MADKSSERGLFECMGEQAMAGGFIGLVIGSSRAYLNVREFSTASKAEAQRLAAQLPGRVSPQTLRSLAPTALPAIAITTASFAGIGAVYGGVENFTAKMRSKDDMWNQVIAGTSAASLAGLRTGSIYTSVGAAAAVAAGMTFVGLLGGTVGSIDNKIVERQRQVYKD